MTLNINTERQVVGLRQQQALIRAVLSATAADESRWLEWKSQHDVRQAAGAFAVSKAILGFANRSPSVALRWAEGHAYLVVGVEEGTVYGVTPYDIADVDAWLTRYLGPFDGYQLTYVPFEDGGEKHQVMLVDVFPPRWGDTIHTLRKTYQNYDAGTIFHRYPGKTEPARPAEIDALVERARRASTQLALDVSCTGAVTQVPANGDARMEALRERRDTLMAQLKPTQPPQTMKLSFLASTPQDARSHETFRQQVDTYIEKCRKIQQQALIHAVSHRGVPLQVTMTNPSEEFLEGVEIVVTLPDGVWAYDPEEEAPQWPKPPKPYGTQSPFLPNRFPAVGPGLVNDASLRRAVRRMNGPQLDNDRPQPVITYPAWDIRGHETLKFGRLTLLTRSTDVTPAVVEWTATAKNVSGVLRGQFTLPVNTVDLNLQAVVTPPS